ncbi:ABC transporter ATP-binding protein [Halocalculus aciditolerans]|uniref:Probable branched-chain amino acid transport ATP-binding protein LivG n=1 Tax=Halocalculus aciditolerans TaxID=1383812 RepID=A0A830F6A7_9EURY|nr:ABC transporter ATP-binding protein [Halocalculus aciditolerans]GGL67609.1 ABC transporter ATP-binding protein [Halocalculus aciditolerans]
MTETILHATDITKEFGGLVALSDVSLDIDEGEIVGLIGPNGAGKTTLFNCLSGALKPTSGTVEFRGEDITGMEPHEVAKRGLARTFQITRPMEDMTVLENAMVGAHIHTRRRGPTRERARDALDFVGLADDADRKAGGLTLGKQKSLELARALATDPELVLVDEIMAGLTPAESERILDRLEAVRERGTSLFVIEHDMHAIMEISDRIKVLDNGKELAFGAPADVVNDPAVVEAYIGEEVEDV